MKEVTSKPRRLQNVTTGHEVYDSLHTRTQSAVPCTEQQCSGSLMMGRKSGIEPRSENEVLKLAKDFIDEYYQSIKRYQSEQHRQRWEQVTKEMAERGTYDLTQTELVYGAKLAWRNAPRCIGRIQWSKLQVFDARYVTTASGMFEALCNHIKYGTNKGNLRSAITVFPQRTDGKHDFRVWNPQLLSYAGYKQEDGSIIGDPINVEFTEVCQRLGWKGEGTRWDVLPLVLSAHGHDPEWFDIPPELVLQVPISHPEYKWFIELGLQWYTLPAVSNLLFDCGGLEFPAAPFNGWYMASEIGTRDLCDPQRLNILETVGVKMGLDTRSPTNLWKDKALVEVNIAVIHSFQKMNVTIMDHHSAAESFMKHFENEQKLRGGCPADWVWIVPPLSGSITPVFHQEMSLYYLKPAYEYQDAAWKVHVWKKNKDINRNSVRKPKRKFRFKEIARAVKFTSKLFGKALSKRIKATILYATETGKSEMYAKKLGEIFGHTFNAQVYSMADYDLINIEHEALVLVVTSTFGNGDPPENGEEFSRKLFYKNKKRKDFAKNLYAMKVSGTAADIDDVTSSLHRSLSFMRMNSLTEGAGAAANTQENGVANSNVRASVTSEIMSEDNFGPLSNVRFAVFALGSSAYPNFCAFGKYVDNLLSELGGEQLMKLTCGDELAGQEQAFNKWAADVFNKSGDQFGCETFCLDDDVAMKEATAALKAEASATADKVKLSSCTNVTDIATGLSRAHSKKVRSCTVLASRNLHGQNASRWTQQVILSTSSANELKYSPGDHVAILPANCQDLVDYVLGRLDQCPDPDQPIQILLQKEIHSINGVTQTWEPHERLPTATVRELVTRYLDITTPPTPNFLHVLAEYACDNDQRTRLEQLATDPHEYEDWKQLRYPHMKEVLEEFPSVVVDAGLMLTQLPLMGPRFYSISSSPDAHPEEIHVTVAVVQYNTQSGLGPLHFGVCSNFLKEVSPGDTVQLFVRRASSFHMPQDPSLPVILVGPGTGVAPFRGFWHHRNYMMQHQTGKPGQMTLFFGCRTKALDLYAEEKEAMKRSGALTQTYLSLSREPNIPKTYVQDMLVGVGAEVYKQVVLEKGHFYVCGDCTMAECVYQKLKTIVQEHGRFSDQEVENFMLQMRDENRYHEDIFGITLRTEEIHRQKRESARFKMSSIVQPVATTSNPTQAASTTPNVPQGGSNMTQGAPATQSNE
ncbi:nitric oxide synthase-like protein isoform X3 [Homarus americanus]|uniref:nitric oxide synthase-like protein isoform X3 n=1 Tax=Homarus americanus TaxID=6706 RepID=UPI001C4896E9|nr:nitric oxide synthase-like protein isoform X3 [Homarus americanus]